MAGAEPEIAVTGSAPTGSCNTWPTFNFVLSTPGFASINAFTETWFTLAIRENESFFRTEYWLVVTGVGAGAALVSAVATILVVAGTLVEAGSNVGGTGKSPPAFCCAVAGPFVSDAVTSLPGPPLVSVGGGSLRQPWISMPRNKTTFAPKTAQTTILNCSRRLRCRSACNEPGPLNGFNVFTVS